MKNAKQDTPIFRLTSGKVVRSEYGFCFKCSDPSLVRFAYSPHVGNTVWFDSAEKALDAMFQHRISINR